MTSGWAMAYRLTTAALVAILAAGSAVMFVVGVMARAVDRRRRRRSIQEERPCR